MGGEGEVEAVASGQASARGSTCSKEWATAELLDTVGRREDDGSYGYSGEVAAAASAMVEEGEGEAMGENGGVQRLGRVEEGRPARPRRGRQAAGAVASSRSPASPLCLLWREQAADWLWASTVLGRQVGCQVSSSLLSVFLLYLFLFCVLK